MTKFGTFIKECKTLLRTSNRIKLVLGNESSDLDSTIGCLAFSFLEYQKTGEIYFPTMKTTAEKISLRSEVINLLNSINLQVCDLVFYGQIEPEKICEIVLIDHF